MNELQPEGSTRDKQRQNVEWKEVTEERPVCFHWERVLGPAHEYCKICMGAYMGIESIQCSGE